MAAPLRQVSPFEMDPLDQIAMALGNAVPPPDANPGVRSTDALGRVAPPADDGGDFMDSLGGFAGSGSRPGAADRPMPQAPAIDPGRAGLEKRAGELGKPNDRSKYKPKLWETLIGLASAFTGGASGDRQAGARVGEAWDSKYNKAEADREKELSGVKGELNEMDTGFAQREKAYQSSVDAYRAQTDAIRADTESGNLAERHAENKQKQREHEEELVGPMLREKDTTGNDVWFRTDRTGRKVQVPRPQEDAKLEEDIRHNKATEDIDRLRAANERKRAEREQRASTLPSKLAAVEKWKSDEYDAQLKLRETALAKAKELRGFMPDSPDAAKIEQQAHASFSEQAKRIEDGYNAQRSQLLGGGEDHPTALGGVTSIVASNGVKAIEKPSGKPPATVGQDSGKGSATVGQESGKPSGSTPAAPEKPSGNQPAAAPKTPAASNKSKKYKVGDKVTIKGGKNVTITKINDNGTFDYQ